MKITAQTKKAYDKAFEDFVHIEMIALYKLVLRAGREKICILWTGGVFFSRGGKKAIAQEKRIWYNHLDQGMLRIERVLIWVIYAANALYAEELGGM